MLDNAAISKFIFDTVELGRAGLGNTELELRYANELKDIFGLDEVKIKEIPQDRSGITPPEEFAINTGKQYIDNRLSSYSAFPELVSYYNNGYKSFAAFPIAADGKAIGVAVLLSKYEEKFSTELTNAVSVGLSILGYQLVSRSEGERSRGLARYFDAAFNSIMPQALIETNGTIVKANKSFLNLFSKSSRDIIGTNIKGFFSIDGNMLASLDKGLTASVEAIGLEDRFFVATSGRVSDKLLHVLFYDVTKEKKLEDQNAILQYSSYECAFFIDNETKIKWVSENIDNIIPQGSSINGRKLIDIIDDKEKLADAMKKEYFTGTFTLNLGNEIYADVMLSLIKRDKGFLCIVTDNKIEKYARNVAKSLEELIQVSGDMIITINELGYLTSINRSAESMLGYKVDELSGTDISLMYSEDSKASFKKAMDVARQEGIAKNIFTNMISKNSEIIPCEQSIGRLVSDKGTFDGYIIIGKELATKRRLEELENAIASAEHSIDSLKSESELKTQFIYNISHELKTPITNIKGFATLLQKGEFGELNEEQKGYIKIILDEGERLMQLIQQILDVAKLSSGKIKLDLQQVNLLKLKENPSIQALEEVANGKGLMFAWNVEYNVPEIIADPNRLIQVFINLIGNAIKFTEHGSISIDVYRKGKGVRIEVKDTGIGISKEDQRKLFRKFYQVPKRGLTKQEGAGTGLGLSIAKEIVALHKGKMGVSSEIGKGSTFWFTIPIDLRKKKKEG
jgi:PAS domain S-box-containing protein